MLRSERMAGRVARRVLVATVASWILVSGSAGALVPPEDDPFYVPPAGLAAQAPGTVLKSRAVTLMGTSPASTAAAHQLLYRTTDAHGKPIATVTTVLLPRAPARAARLVAFNQAYDSLTLACAPSYKMQSPPSALRLVEDEQAAGLLRRGWTVTIADYEGPESAWTVGRLSGQATLDAIRATLRFAPAGLDAQTPAASMGYSGGAIPAMWANGLWKTYAPEVNFVGIAAGGLPADLEEALRRIDGSVFFGAAFGVLAGTIRGYPEHSAIVDRLLNARGKEETAKAGRDAGGCSGSVTQAPFGRVADYFVGVRSGAELADLCEVQPVLAKTAITSGPVFGAPAFLYHEQHDQLAPVKAADDLVAFNCRRGVPIEYVRDPLGEHIVGGLTYAPVATRWLADRFDGKTVPNTCTERSMAGAAAAPGPCASRRVVRYTLPRGATRVRLLVGGNRTKVVRTGRVLAVSLVGLPRGRVSVKITARVGSRNYTRRSTLHPCA
ncbi:hypothetical protein DSM112329_02056 [Paraconexibacter sp. AEG42_29]|uniref:Lipase n=1 Tax=Paraconexibacter sp. AEG42_29 TaxID=2997339 RepID=A0AAU7AUB1_9ACTN